MSAAFVNDIEEATAWTEGDDVVMVVRKPDRPGWFRLRLSRDEARRLGDQLTRLTP